jgi:hypothetical protein
MGECLVFPGIGQSHKSDNSEWRTSYVVSDVSMRVDPHLYVNLAAVGSWSLLCSLPTDRTENTTTNCSIVACVSVAAITWRLLSHCLTTTVSADFTILQQTFENILFLFYLVLKLCQDHFLPRSLVSLFTSHPALLCSVVRVTDSALKWTVIKCNCSIFY